MLRPGTPYSVLGTLVLLVGCGRSPARVEVGELAVAEATPQPVADTPQAPAAEPPPGFPFPDDPAGRALPGVVAPPPRAAFPAERTGPKPRTPPAKVEFPDPPLKSSVVLPPVPPGPAKTTKPTTGLARVPAGFGAWAGSPPRATLPDTPGMTARGPDPAKPPAPPATAKPAPERPSADDPAAAAADAATTGRPATVVLAMAGFVRVVIPDPFELAEHVKGVPPPAVEPVAVPPRRPR